MKKCPFCAEEILDEAIVCRYCGRDLIDPQIQIQETPSVPIETKTAKKSSPIVLVLILVCIISGLLYLSFGYKSSGNPNRSSSSGSSSSRKTTKVTYQVFGSKGATKASLTWNNEQGGTEQGDYNLPFKKDFYFTDETFVYISAQNDGDRGTVSCWIGVNDQEFKYSTSSGAYAIATCSGSLR